MFKVQINGVIISCNKSCGINIKGERNSHSMTGAHSSIIIIMQNKHDKVQSEFRVYKVMEYCAMHGEWSERMGFIYY